MESSCWVLRLLCLASLLLLSAALSPPTPPPAARPLLPDKVYLARLCDPQRAQHAMSLSWCKQLPLRRHGGMHYRPAPPPGRDGEEVHGIYGVAKRLVPSGPNPLHN